MGKLRTALRVVTDMGSLVLGLGAYLIGQPVAAGVIIAVGSYFLWGDVYGEGEPT